MRRTVSIFVTSPLVLWLIILARSAVLADVCWQREIERVDKETGKITYRSRAVPCPDDRPGNREGVCWQREIERIDPTTGKVTYRNRAVPCAQVP